MSFNFSNCYNIYAAEHYKVFGKTIPFGIKKRLNKIRKSFLLDEHTMMQALCPKELRNGVFVCPKCKKETTFYSNRINKQDKVIRERKWVRVEANRSYVCGNCSFTFHPLANSPYRNIKLDLRIIVFFMFISDDGNINFPAASVGRIFDITYSSAKRLISFQKDGREFSKKEIDKILSKGENHWKIDILSQAFSMIKR